MRGGHQFGGGSGGGAFSATSPANLRWQEDINAGSSAGNGCMEDRVSAGAGGSTTLTWTNTQSDDWATIAVELIPGSFGTNTSPAWATNYDTTAVAGTGTWTNPGNAEGTGSSGGPWATWTAP